jgi:hypothetical protein
VDTPVRILLDTNSGVVIDATAVPNAVVAVMSGGEGDSLAAEGLAGSATPSCP